MQLNRIIETIGIVVKEELLQTVNHSTMPNTCVYEAKEPFAGYYGSDPEVLKPMHIFLILKGKYELQRLIRATQKIKKNSNISFDACKAEISLFNTSNQAIRIKDIDNYEVIHEIQELYMNEGFKMKTEKRQVIDKGTIKIEKSFHLEEIQKGIFFDKLEKEMAYFEIPHTISWKLFEKYSEKVKHNWEEKSFDAALTNFIRAEGIIDAVRVYTREQSIEFLTELRSLYLKLMSNL